MAIVLYTGTPGSGKSLHLVSVILLNLAKGLDVIANFAIKFTDKEIKKGYDKRFHYMTNEQITVNSLLEFAIDQGYFELKKEDQCVVVIDEAGGRYNPRDYKDKDRTEWIDYFSQHRKTGLTFILSAQQDRMIDRQIRGFIETEKKHRKINNFGLFALLPFPVFVCIEYWYTAKQRVGSEFFRYRKHIGNRYDTMKMFEGFKLSPHLMRKIEERKMKALKEEVFKKDVVPGFGDTPITVIFKDDGESD